MNRLNDGERVLLVEDDAVYAEVLAKALQRRGFEVTTANSCGEARTHIARMLPDLAVLDLRVGDESGLSLVPLLTRGAAPARTIVLTGYGSIATAVEAIKLGATQYLTKPVDVDEILTALMADENEPDDVRLSTRPLSVRRLEWEHIQRVLKENEGNISATARALGIHRRTLQRKLQKKPVGE